MDELDLLRKKRLNELQNQASQEDFQHQQLQAELAKLEQVIKQRMTKEAVSRYGNIKLAQPETAMRVLGMLVQVLERNADKIFTDDDLKSLLAMLNSSKKKDFKITRK